MRVGGADGFRDVITARQPSGALRIEGWASRRGQSDPWFKGKVLRGRIVAMEFRGWGGRRPGGAAWRPSGAGSGGGGNQAGYAVGGALVGAVIGGAIINAPCDDHEHQARATPRRRSRGVVSRKVVRTQETARRHGQTVKDVRTSRSVVRRRR